MKIKMLFTIAVIGIILLIGIFYIALRSTDTDISQKEPYAGIINQILLTEREAILAKNLPEFSIKKPYIITEDTALFEGVEKVAIYQKEPGCCFQMQFITKMVQAVLP